MRSRTQHPNGESTEPAPKNSMQDISYVGRGLQRRGVQPAGAPLPPDRLDWNDLEKDLAHDYSPVGARGELEPNVDSDHDSGGKAGTQRSIPSFFPAHLAASSSRARSHSCQPDFTGRSKSERIERAAILPTRYEMQLDFKDGPAGLGLGLGRPMAPSPGPAHYTDHEISQIQAARVRHAVNTNMSGAHAALHSGGASSLKDMHKLLYSDTGESLNMQHMQHSMHEPVERRPGSELVSFPSIFPSQRARFRHTDSKRRSKMYT